LIDYHLHTRLCKHAVGNVDEYVISAIDAGLKEIAFTDHIPLPDNFDIAHRMALFEMDKYQEWILKAQEKFPEIKILFGIEADYYQGFETFLSDFLANFDFDLVIMSVHFIASWFPGNWVFDYDFPEKEKSEIFTEYIDTLIAGIETGIFDVVGHADIIKRPGESIFSVTPEKVSQLIGAAKKQNMAIEFNTSSFRKQAGISYPDPDWIPLITEHNIPITLGSDAHAPEQIALNFDRVLRMLKQAGISRLARYRKRNRSDIPLQIDY